MTETWTCAAKYFTGGKEEEKILKYLGEITSSPSPFSLWELRLGMQICFLFESCEEVSSKLVYLFTILHYKKWMLWLYLGLESLLNYDNPLQKKCNQIESSWKQKFYCSTFSIGWLNKLHDVCWCSNSNLIRLSTY